jgi:hypothetical protein
MLDVALQFLIDELNSYPPLQKDPNVVRLGYIVDDTGKCVFEKETICANLINIEEERILKSHLPEYTYVNGQHVRLEPELKLNLYILFAARFQQYKEALKFISHLLTYFQAHSAFTSAEYPALDPSIEKLTLELQSLSYEQLNQIWAFIGGKQLPSVIYKVRMVVIQDKAQLSFQPPITQISADLFSQ